MIIHIFILPFNPTRLYHDLNYLPLPWAQGFPLHFSLLLNSCTLVGEWVSCSVYFPWGKGETFRFQFQRFKGTAICCVAPVLSLPVISLLYLLNKLPFSLSFSLKIFFWRCDRVKGGHRWLYSLCGWNDLTRWVSIEYHNAFTIGQTHTRAFQQEIDPSDVFNFNSLFVYFEGSLEGRLMTIYVD